MARKKLDMKQVSSVEGINKLVSTMYAEARKTGESERFYKNNDEEHYFRIAYDEEYDKNDEDLFSYLDLSHGLYFMNRRSEKEFSDLIFFEFKPLK